MSQPRIKVGRTLQSLKKTGESTWNLVEADSFKGFEPPSKKFLAAPLAWDKFNHFIEINRSKDTLQDTFGIACQMRDVPMTNTTAIHSEKSNNCTASIPLPQQPGIRQKEQLP